RSSSRRSRRLSIIIRVIRVVQKLQKLADSVSEEVVLAEQVSGKKPGRPRGAMVILVESGFARQRDVARAFSCSVRTVRRYQERYARDGMVAFAREEGWRRGRRRISSKRLRTIEMLKSQGLSNRAIAHRMGVRENAIRKLIGPSK